MLDSLFDKHLKNGPADTALFTIGGGPDLSPSVSPWEVFYVNRISRGALLISLNSSNVPAEPGYFEKRKIKSKIGHFRYEIEEGFLGSPSRYGSNIFISKSEVSQENIDKFSDYLKSVVSKTEKIGDASSLIFIGPERRFLAVSNSYKTEIPVEVMEDQSAVPFTSQFVEENYYGPKGKNNSRLIYKNYACKICDVKGQLEVLVPFEVGKSATHVSFFDVNHGDHNYRELLYDGKRIAMRGFLNILDKRPEKMESVLGI